MNMAVPQHLLKTIDHIIKVEGSAYTNHPSDRGGPTKYGITQATLSRHLGRHALASEVASLTEDVARAIYFKLYVDDPDFDLIPSAKLALELIDSGVNVGVGRAASWLQRSLNALNRKGRDWPDLKVDGDIGPATLNAMRRFSEVRGPENAEIVLYRMLNALQGAHYINLAENSESQEDFVYGWFFHRVG